ERAPQQGVGLALAVDVGGDDRLDSLAGPQQLQHALVVDGLPEVHEAPAAPGAHGDVTGFSHGARKLYARRRGTISRRARRARGSPRAAGGPRTSSTGPRTRGSSRSGSRTRARPARSR